MKSGNIAKYKEEYVIIISNIYPGSGVLVKNKDGVEISVHKKELRIMYDNSLDAIEKLHKLIEVKDMMIDSMLQACEKIVEHVENGLDEKIGGTDADA